ncbi:MAG TPA: GTPase [Planctomycetota bacterium]|nr:GTPase [Planctomycetota bacterium]
MAEPTFAACASATGGHGALIRMSGGEATTIARRAGLRLGAAWTIEAQDWPLAGGTCPCRVLAAPAGRSFTGADCVEITLPGSAAVVGIAVQALLDAGAQAAPPGAFTRMALANGRISLDQAEAILALGTAATASAAARALRRLTGALASDLKPARERLIAARAQVEAGLDFLDEEDVRAYDPAALRALLAELRGAVGRWLAAAGSLGGDPVVVLVGPANAGKSALFARLTGATALVSAVAGTTRDWLDAEWLVGGRRLRLIDTAGWLDGAAALDELAIARGRALIDGAALILACSAPDAPLPSTHGLPAERTLVLAMKSDLGPGDARAALACSADTGAGLAVLTTLVGDRLAEVDAAEPRQERLLREADAILARLADRLPKDVLLADDLARIADLIGDLTGATTTDDVLAAIFARFCIGK